MCIVFTATLYGPADWQLWALCLAAVLAGVLAWVLLRHVVYTAVTHLTTMVQRPFTAQDGAGGRVLPPFTPLARQRVSTIEAHLTNQLGNHVFQYIYARTLAANMGVQFRSPPLGGPFKHLDTDLQPPATPPQPQQAEAATALLNRAGNVWMQDTSIYSSAQWRDIKRWLGHSVSACEAALEAQIQGGTGGGTLPQLGPHDIVAHVRLGDIVSGLHASYRPLPYLFYREALAAVIARQGGALPRRVLLVTNEPHHAIVQRLKSNLQQWMHAEHPSSAPDGPTPCVLEVYSHSMLGDFALMRHAPNLVLSVSTFSWWAGVLGKGFVVMPCHGNAWPSSAPPAFSSNAAVCSDSWQTRRDGLWNGFWEDVLCGGAFTWGAGVQHVAAATGVSAQTILRARGCPPAPPLSFQVLGSPEAPAEPPSQEHITSAENSNSSSAAFMAAVCVPEGARQCLFFPEHDTHRIHYIALHLGRWGGMKHVDSLFVGAPDSQ